MKKMCTKAVDNNIKLIDIDQNFNRAEKIFLFKTPQLAKRKKKVIFIDQIYNNMNNQLDESHFDKVARKPNYIPKETKEFREDSKPKNELILIRNESSKKKRKPMLPNKKIKKNKKINDINIIINKNINNNECSNINDINMTDKNINQKNAIRRCLTIKKPKSAELTHGIEDQTKINKNLKKKIKKSKSIANINRNKNKKDYISSNYYTKGKEDSLDMSTVKKSNSSLKQLQDKDSSQNFIGNIKKLFCCFN